MCGRYSLKAPADALRRAFGFVEQPNLTEAELKALLKPAPEVLLAYVPVSLGVNAAQPDDTGLIEPAGLEVVAA